MRSGFFPPMPPPLSTRDLTEAPRAPSVACCIVQGSLLPFGHAPCVCFNGRENRGRGRPVSAARKPRGAAMVLHPCLQSSASARRERSSAMKRDLRKAEGATGGRHVKRRENIPNTRWSSKLGSDGGAGYGTQSSGEDRVNSQPIPRNSGCHARRFGDHTRLSGTDRGWFTTESQSR